MVSADGVVVEIFVVVTGPVLSPPVAGWFAAAAPPSWGNVDGTAAVELSTADIDSTGIVEGCAVLGVGWAGGPCGEGVVAPNSCWFVSGTPDCG